MRVTAIMSEDEVYLSGKRFISLKRAHELSGYSKDYIGQLCRRGKVASERVGRDWFVDLDRLLSYKKDIREDVRQHQRDFVERERRSNNEISSGRDISLSSILSSSPEAEKILALKFVSFGVAIAAAAAIFTGTGLSSFAKVIDFSKNLASSFEEVTTLYPKLLEESVKQSVAHATQVGLTAHALFEESSSLGAEFAGLYSDWFSDATLAGREFGLKVTMPLGTGFLAFSQNVSKTASAAEEVGGAVLFFSEEFPYKVNTLSTRILYVYWRGLSTGSRIFSNTASSAATLTTQGFLGARDLGAVFLSIGEKGPFVASGLIDLGLEKYARFLDGSGENLFSFTLFLERAPGLALELYDARVLRFFENLAASYPRILLGVGDRLCEEFASGFLPIFSALGRGTSRAGENLLLSAVTLEATSDRALSSLSNFLRNVREGYVNLPENVEYILRRNAMVIEDETPLPEEQSPLKALSGNEVEKGVLQRIFVSDGEDVALRAEVDRLRRDLDALQTGGLTVSGPGATPAILERVVERIVGGVSGAELDARLEALNRELLNRIVSVQSSGSARSDAIFQTVAHTQKIDTLKDTTITDATIENPTITGTLTSAGISSSGSATFGGTIGASGTGTSTFGGGLQAVALNITSTSATSTFSNGIQLSAGCYRLPDGTCAGGTLASGSTIISGGTSGSILFVDASSALTQDNSNLFWNDAYNRLGVGTSSPTATLAIEQNGTSSPFIVSDQGTSTPHFIIDAFGRVGLGTTTPGTLFSVVGAAHITASTTFGGAITVGTLSSDPSLAANGSIYYDSTTGALRAYTSNAWNPLGGGFTKSGTVVSLATASDQVAIGTTTPSGLSQLTVGASTTAAIPLTLKGVSGQTGDLFRILNSGDTGLLTVTSAGNLGVGTSTPNWLLQAAGTRPSFALTDTAAGADLKHWTLSSQGGSFYLATSSDAYATSTVSALSVSANGLVGISTTTPGALFSVGGNILGAGILTLTGTGTSTLSGGLQTTALNVTSTSATSTFSNGIQLSGGCFRLPNGDCAGAGLTIDGTSISSGTSGSALFVSATGLLSQDNANFFWDDTNNRLGVGTTSPFARLSVNSIAGAQAFVVGSSTATTFIVDANARVGVSTTTPYALFSVHAPAGLPSFVVGSSTATTFIVDALQQVGVGSTTPSARLAVTGLGTGTGRLLALGDSSGAERLTILDNGRVGIGTTTPMSQFVINALQGNTQNLFHVASSTDNYLTISSTGTTTIPNLVTGALSFDVNAGYVTAFDLPVTSNASAGTVEGYIFQHDASTTLALYSESDGSGGVRNQRVGVGTSTPTEMFSVADRLYVGGLGTSTIENNLYVRGTLRSTVSYVGDLIFGNNFRFTEAPATSSLQALWLQNQYGATVLAIDEEGNIGLGTTTPAYKLHVLGDVAATGFVNISTEAAKKDITFLNEDAYEKALEAIKGTNIATYNYKAETCGISESINTELQPGGPCAKRLGLIAEEAPTEVLSDDKNGVDIYKMTSLVYAAVKAQQTNIERLEVRLADLEARAASGQFSSSASGGGVSIGSLLSSVLSSVKAVAGQFVEVVADRITAKKVVTDALELKDSVTGDVYCVRITQGEWSKFKGTCGEVPVSLSSSQVEQTGQQVEQLEQTLLGPVEESVIEEESPVEEIEETPAGEEAVTVEEKPVVEETVIEEEAVTVGEQAVVEEAPVPAAVEEAIPAEEQAIEE